VTALTKARTSGSIRFINRDFRPLAANAKVWPGALACVITGGGTSSGYYVQGKAGSHLVAVGRYTGLSSAAVAVGGVIDNTGGADGAISAEIEFFEPFYIFLLVNDTVSAVVVADRGSECYILDDQTATHAASGNGPAGLVYDVTTEGVWVQVWTGPSIPSTFQAGTATLVAGTVTVTGVNLTAASRILVTMKDPGAGAIAAFAALDVPNGTRVVGAPGTGQFAVNAIDNTKATIATAVCTFDWCVIG
jgi:hypothetical protein